MKDIRKDFEQLKINYGLIQKKLFTILTNAIS